MLILLFLFTLRFCFVSLSNGQCFDAVLTMTLKDIAKEKHRKISIGSMACKVLFDANGLAIKLTLIY